MEIKTLNFEVPKPPHKPFIKNITFRGQYVETLKE